jgi:hypothetical protein
MLGVSSLHDVHVANGWALIGLNALVGVWCLAAFQWSLLRGRSLWIVVITAQVTVFAQAVIGAVLANRDGVELHDMHALYGFSAIIAVAIMYSYRTSPFLKGKELLLYGFGSLFVMGVDVRNLVL